MDDARHQTPARTTAEILDFDAAMLRACAPSERADLMQQAELLAGAFAPGGAPADLERMARQLANGRHHARRLAAALKHLARAA